MAKKKRKLPKRNPERPSERVPIEEPVHQLPDRRAIEGVMRGILGRLAGSGEQTPLSKAQTRRGSSSPTWTPAGGSAGRWQDRRRIR